MAFTCFSYGTDARYLGLPREPSPTLQQVARRPPLACRHGKRAQVDAGGGTPSPHGCNQGGQVTSDARNVNLDVVRASPCGSKRSYDSLYYSRPKARAASRTPRTAASVALTAAIITPPRRRSTISARRQGATRRLSIAVGFYPGSRVIAAAGGPAMRASAVPVIRPLQPVPRPMAQLPLVTPS